jgi:triosephosphate isomerase
VATKALRVLELHMTPVVCVGETLEQRTGGATESVIARQLHAVLDQLTCEQAAHIVIAYEPVWAIGTGKSASSEQAQAAHAFLRAQLNAKDASLTAPVRILYGGSVKPDNAKALFALPDIDGGLVGGAALNATDFLAICKAASIN